MLSGALQLDAVDREDVVADVDVDARRRERRAQIRIPALVVVDARDLVAPAFDREVSAEQTARRRRHVGHVAAAHVRVADRDLGAHVVEQVVEIGAMVDVRQQLAVHLLHLRPVGAVHVRHVEIVALVAPAFVEDLLELLASARDTCAASRSDVPDRLAARLRSASTRTEVHRWRRRRRHAHARRHRRRRAIEQLATVGADVVLRDAGHERRRAPIAQAIAMQGGAAAGSAPATAGRAPRGSRRCPRRRP